MINKCVPALSRQGVIKRPPFLSRTVTASKKDIVDKRGLLKNAFQSIAQFVLSLVMASPVIGTSCGALRVAQFKCLLPVRFCQNCWQQALQSITLNYMSTDRGKAFPAKKHDQDSDVHW